MSSTTTMRRYALTGLFLLALAGCSTPIQLLYDAEVDRLCAKDGGIQVYETVTLPADRFDKYGRLKIQSFSDERTRYGEDFQYQYSIEYVKGEPGLLDVATLTKHTAKISRSADGRVLGSLTYYGRSGGDIPLGIHPSGYSCPHNVNASVNLLITKIFQKAVQ